MVRIFSFNNLFHFILVRWKIIIAALIISAAVGGVYGVNVIRSNQDSLPLPISETDRVMCVFKVDIGSGSNENYLMPSDYETQIKYNQIDIILKLPSIKDAAILESGVTEEEASRLSDSVEIESLSEGLYIIYIKNMQAPIAKKLQDIYIGIANDKLHALNPNYSISVIHDSVTDNDVSIKDSTPDQNTMIHKIKSLLLQMSLMCAAGVISVIMFIIIWFLLGDYAYRDTLYSEYKFKMLGIINNKRKKTAGDQRLALNLSRLLDDLPSNILILASLNKYGNPAAAANRLKNVLGDKTEVNNVLGDVGIIDDDVKSISEQSSNYDCVLLPAQNIERTLTPEIAEKLGAGFILMIKEGVTRHQQIVNALSLLDTAGVHVCGFIIV